MKNLFFLALSASAFAGCSGSGGKCDTGDTSGCDAGAGGDVLLELYDQDPCTDSSCTWWVQGSGEIGTVEVWMIETGDPTYTAGCTDTMTENGGLVCGVWSEYHNNFQTTDIDDDGYETKAITLDVETDYRDQVTNQSTLFAPSIIASQLTWLIFITDSSGDYADCVTYGHDLSYFSSDCANRF